MNLEDTPEEAAFRAEVRTWLETHAQPRTSATATSPMAQASFNEAEHVARCKAWQRTLYDGGWAGITWPKAYGGRGATPMQSMIFNQEQAKFDVTSGVFSVGIGMVGPTLIRHGSEEQKDRYLEPMLRGDEVWCQLFSEPGAGSDLAGLGTRAVRDGEEWVVNGQKVWNSGAHYSDLGILLARTDPDQPKHRGITYFLVDMKTPGIDVRPLRQITGQAHFNEVFLSDVRIPGENVVGEVNGGWGIAATTLANERVLIGGGAGGGGFRELVALAQAFGRCDDLVIRQGLADTYIRGELLRFFGYRMQTAISQGRQPGPESSVVKLAVSQHLSRTADLALAIEGAAGMLHRGDAHNNGQWQMSFLSQWSSKIGGGTDQIQRNVIGERVLGLPGEPRPDKTLPWRDTVGGVL